MLVQIFFEKNNKETDNTEEITKLNERSIKNQIKKIKSYKRKISEEMQNRQLLLIGSELLKINAKIAKEMYKISSIDETIALIILENFGLFLFVSFILLGWSFVGEELLSCFFSFSITLNGNFIIQIKSKNYKME